MIYVVFGSTGEYSDRSEWPIIAVTTEDRAKEIVTQLDENARVVLHFDEDRWSPDVYKILRDGVDKLNALFPNAVQSYIGYTGVGYWYSEVPTE